MVLAGTFTTDGAHSKLIQDWTGNIAALTHQDLRQQFLLWKRSKVECWRPSCRIYDPTVYTADGYIWGGKDDRDGICLAKVWEYEVDHVVFFPGDIDMPDFNLT